MRRAATALLAIVTILASAPGAGAADPTTDLQDARGAARAAAAVELGRRSTSGVELAGGSGTTVRIAGREYWTGTYVAGDRGTFVAVDLSTGDVLDASRYQARAEIADARAARITPPARERIDAALGGPTSGRLAGDVALDRSRGPLLAYLLEPVDASAAVETVKAAYPELDWVGDRPVGDDLETLSEASHRLIVAKAALVREQRAPFLAAARRHGATDIVALDLAPIVYARVPARRVEALAAREDVRQVRAPSAWTPTMNTAHDAVGANWTDGKGYTGSGVIIGIVEYAKVDYSRPGLGGTRRDSYRVSSTGLSCPHSAGEYRNASAISHVSWAAAIAVGRGRTYKGVANGAKLVDVSADFDPRSDRADPRILKAVDCAILLGKAHVITMSLVQNDASTYATSNAYFDAVVWDHHRLIVANGGNNYAETNSHCPGTNERVRSPGSAWNVLTVGGTSNDARRLWYRSNGSEPAYCWEDPPGHTGDVHDRVKPEVVAPAQNVSTYFYNGSGVSASTPMVAGIVAQLIDQRPTLLNFPEQMKAIILAGSSARHALTPGGSRSISAEGLGTADAKWSSRVVERNDTLHTGSHGGLTFTSDEQRDGCQQAPPAQSLEFEVPYTSRRLRFVVAWMAHTAQADPRSGSTVSRRLTDFDVTIMRGSTVIGRSTRSASNIEWVDFTGSKGTGTYRAVITPVRWGCAVTVEPVGFAWVSFTTP